MTQSQSRVNIRRLTQFSMLLAIEIVLGVTPLGLILVPPVAVTLLHIPVIICGVVMGPLYGGLLGGAFGLISLIKAITSAVSPGDLLFNPAASGSPLASVVMCLVPRILLGIIAALLYRVVLKASRQNRALAVGVSAVASTVLHTLMVLGCLSLFFSAIPLIDVFKTILTLNCGLEILASVVVAIPVSLPLLKMTSGSGKPAPETAPEK